ncbi:hypothetical protein [Alloscardovia omnicolens]|uniref:hypothetical protein n=1 Tax=Alloscardovia omnicolens TaxID=419015 RepID=UPI003A6D0459
MAETEKNNVISSSDMGAEYDTAADRLESDNKADTKASAEEQKNNEPRVGEEAREEAEEALEQHRKSHRNRAIVLTIIFAVIAVLLVTAFVWPGWARKTAENGAAQATGQEEVIAVDPVQLPPSATDLQKILPDTVGNYARGEVQSTTVWESAEPVEEYQVTYTTGDTDADIQLTVGQWTASQYAQEQYDSLIHNLNSAAIASGKVNVGGNETGSYEIHEDSSNKKNSIAVWHNDTAVMWAVGPKNAVNNFFANFPY